MFRIITEFQTKNSVYYLQESYQNSSRNFDKIIAFHKNLAKISVSLHSRQILYKFYEFII